ncbi:hypothetical protein K7X08_002061 [Anisodus acutangulus]|uniref:Uncharacterized protein n=1 Tax=Anisodus acutangulus TaxID=402998 RepID=A0A9Q1LSB8_9SOLA|nr:hypothetical protein K7X08_002061 [Anisodus acutangulus]
MYVPDPYGIEIGNPKEVPDRFEERWVLNLHAIDTRGVEDRLGCTECKCDLYNVTKDDHGGVIEPDYIGGLRCCYDQTRCRWKKPENSTAKAKHPCQMEYSVEPCSSAGANVGCTDTKKLSVPFPIGGDVIYGVAHQHAGGAGSTLHGEDGREICSSHPIYGKGKEPGDEAGYVVGMSTCYPKPGSIKIMEGETVTLLTNYSSARRHTGVMSLFYLLVAETSPKANSIPNSTDRRGTETGHNVVGASAGFGVGLLVLAAVFYQRRKKREEGYDCIVI